MEVTQWNLHHGTYLVELTPLKSLSGTYTKEFAPLNLHHGKYLMEGTPWKLRSETYTMEVN